MATENLLPDSQAFRRSSRDEMDMGAGADLGYAVDMDAPKHPRKLSMDSQKSPEYRVAGDQEPLSEAPTMPVGTQNKKRFRKRSVNITTLPDDQLKSVDEIFNELDAEKTGFISREAVARVLKDNYRPSEVEVEEVMLWLNNSGDGRVVFNEYMVAMASVMTKAGLNENNDIETARAELSKVMQDLTREAQEGDKEVPKAVAMEATESNMNNARVVIGESNLAHMKERFEGLDTEKKGYLGKDEIRELVRLTYVASKENLDAFMRFFDVNNAEKISRSEFRHGITLLYGDFSLVIKANNRMLGDGIVRSKSFLNEEPKSPPDDTPPEDSTRNENLNLGV